MDIRLRLLAGLATAAFFAACTGTGGAATAVPVPSEPAPSTFPTPGASGWPPIDVSTPEAAARQVLATDSRFRAIQPFDPSMIGQAAWYRVTPTADGWRVVVRIGWGDCPSGCMHEHRWTYEVTRDGGVGFVGETGPSVPPDVVSGIGGNPGGGVLGVSGRVTAGPTCPVVRNPPDPSCADRPVPGAVLVVTDTSGREVARATSAANGDFSIPLPAGSYVLAPQPVEGLMGTAGKVDFTIGAAGPPITFDVQYDTGIR
jgi:hypothetical protein